jgi:hypothetical protein
MTLCCASRTSPLSKFVREVAKRSEKRPREISCVPVEEFAVTGHFPHMEDPGRSLGCANLIDELV